jgi:predicted ribosomally synthesized peptide with nif11-like leader
MERISSLNRKVPTMNPENTQGLAPVATQVQALLAKYQSDPVFKAAFDAAGPTEAAVQLAAQHGFKVSLRDVQALGSVSEDVSDALLEHIAGGEGTSRTINISFN